MKSSRVIQAFRHFSPSGVKYVSRTAIALRMAEEDKNISYNTAITFIAAAEFNGVLIPSGTGPSTLYMLAKEYRATA